uniref:Uncharacterized protein n=1 Tax=Fagus sylvatica TaxID=28930 RepID=A0A2N9HDD2_FAGSY
MVGENWGLKLVKPQLDNQTWFGNSSKQSGKNWDLTLSRIAIGWSDPVWNLSPNGLRGDLTWELPKLQIGWFQRFGISVQTAANRVVSTVWNLSPNRLRGDLTWDYPSCKSGGFNGLESQSKQVEGCLIEVVVAGAIAGPHALDSCECMNIEDAMRASLRWLLLCLLGRSALASHTLGLAISQCGITGSMVRPMDKPKNSLFPGFDTITDLGDSARGVHSPG